MNNETLEHKLNMIFDELIDIKWKLEKAELQKRKKEAQESKILAEREITEVDYQENDYWNYREKIQKEFNHRFGEVEEK